MFSSSNLHDTELHVITMTWLPIVPGLCCFSVSIFPQYIVNIHNEHHPNHLNNYFYPPLQENLLLHLFVDVPLF